MKPGGGAMFDIVLYATRLRTENENDQYHTSLAS